MSETKKLFFLISHVSRIVGSDKSLALLAPAKKLNFPIFFRQQMRVPEIVSDQSGKTGRSSGGGHQERLQPDGRVFVGTDAHRPGVEPTDETGSEVHQRDVRLARSVRALRVHDPSGKKAFLILSCQEVASARNTSYKAVRLFVASPSNMERTRLRQVGLKK